MIGAVSRRGQFVPWVTAGRVTEQQINADDVVKETGWVFNNETGDELTLEQFVTTGDEEVPAYLNVFGSVARRPTPRPSSRSDAGSAA